MASVASHQMPSFDGESQQTRNSKSREEKQPQQRPNYSLQFSLAGHTRSIAALKFSNDGFFLASAGADKVAKTWCSKDGKFERVIIFFQREALRENSF